MFSIGIDLHRKRSEYAVMDQEGHVLTRPEFCREFF